VSDGSGPAGRRCDLGSICRVDDPARSVTARCRYFALAAAQSTAGSTDVAIDVAHNELTMKLQMPGNIKSIMTRLKAAGFAIPTQIRAVVPVRSLGLPERRPDVPHTPAEINASAHVKEASLDGDQLTALIGPSSKGLYQIYWSLIHAGLVAQDTPTLPAIRGL
jgi:hypothetical protein